MWIWRHAMRATRSREAALSWLGTLWLAIVAGACSSGHSSQPDPNDGPAPVNGPQHDAGHGASAVHALFELSTDPMRFGAIPWPDDLYLDSAQRIAVRDLGGLETARDYRESLVAALADLDGFGISPTVYFRFDGDLDPESLPPDVEATTDEDASVFLLDVDPSSSEAFSRIPVQVVYHAEQRRIALRPAYLRRLSPGRRYAAVVTSGVRAASGGAIAAAARFHAIRDASVVLADPRELEARAHYTPVLETLASQGVAREEVVALAVFRVQTVGRDLMEARQLVRAEPPEPPSLTSFVVGDELDAVLGMPAPGAFGLDAERGAPHANVGAMVHGSYRSPNFLSEAVRTHGQFERPVSGLEVKRVDEVYFTLWLPRGAMGALPLAIVQHGWGGDRSDALALAETLLGMGYAVIAIDLPFHGLRSGRGDSQNRFTGAAAPDAFGDASGDFAGIDEREGELERAHPFYYRDAVRQSVVDLMALVHVLQEGDWSALNEEPDAPIAAMLDAERLVFAGIDLGGELGVMLAPHEPALGALVVAFAGGLTFDGWLDSPARTAQRDALLGRLGRGASALSPDPAEPSLWPELEVVRTLLSRGSALGHARAARRAEANMLLLMARDDEVVNNRSTEALAYELGAQTASGEARYIDALAPAALRDGRVGANFPADDPRVLRVLVELSPATHTTLIRARGEYQYVHPVEPPFARRAEPVPVDNPIALALRQTASFFESYRACPAGDPPGVCAASVPLD